MGMSGPARALFLSLFSLALMAQRPWQRITVPPLDDVAANFKTPPREYGAIHWAIWGGELTKERIVSEFDSLAANGVFIVNFGPAQRMTPAYFSPEHLALTKFAVEEAAKRGMKVWLADEGSYPSGLAGGKISKEYPQLSMQGIVADIRIRVAPGQRLSVPVPPDTLAIMEVETSPDQQVQGIVPIPDVLAALPKPDVKLDSEFRRLTYMHRSWRDAEMYFFFNESNQAESRTATIAGRGQAQAWDLGTGEIHAISGAAAEGDSVRFPLALGPYEAKMIVVGPLPTGVAAPEPALAAGNTLAELVGEWTLDLNGKQVTTPLRSWEDLGTPSFAGPATYRKQFTATAAPAGKRVFLEIADVNDYARVKLNGKGLEGHAWQPYRWEVTNVVKVGANDLEVEVRTTASGRGGFGGPPPGVGGSGGRGPRRGAAAGFGFAGAGPAGGALNVVH